MKNIELANGSVIEAPDAEGTIRVRDEDGNCGDIFRVGDVGYEKYLGYFSPTSEEASMADVTRPMSPPTDRQALNVARNALHTVLYACDIGQTDVVLRRLHEQALPKDSDFRAGLNVMDALIQVTPRDWVVPVQAASEGEVWSVQHDQDNEPTYVVPSYDKDGEYVTLSKDIPVEKRLALAEHIRAFLSH